MTWADAATWLATGLGLGRVPLLPGTAGALAGVGLALALARVHWRPRFAVTVLLVMLAWPLCAVGERYLAPDDPGIVADELLTFPVATVVLPVRGNPALLAGVFVTSRALDALKPPPARAAERLGGGLGIVLDDLITNGYTLALGLLLWRWRPRNGARGER